VVVAGPLFNFIFAVFAYWALYMIGIDGIKPVVGKVVEGSIAEKGGFRVGDELLQLDDKDVVSWNHRRLYIFERALNGSTIRAVVRDKDGVRQTRILDLSELPVSKVNAALLGSGLGLYGYVPEVLPVIGDLKEGPAKNAGMRVGDRIIRIGEQPIETWEDVVEGVSPRAGELIQITIDRAGEQLTFELTPEPVQRDGKTVGLIKIAPSFGEIPLEWRAPGRCLC
jgi:regulator of sigma E protease